MSKNLLSKSTFIRSLQCQKSLYLYKRHTYLRDKISEEQQAIFNRGHSVGALAQKLFPGGVDAGWKSPRQYKKSVNLTQKYIADGKKVIYEAAFLYNDILVALDILVKKDDGWHAYEVKSSLQPSETFLRDAALQNHVITKSGFPLQSFSLVHLNRDYVRGTKLDLDGLFKIIDVTDKVAERALSVISGIYMAKETLRYREIPPVDIGRHCFTPYPCDFQQFCWKHVAEKSIFQLSELEDDRKWKLYKQGIVETKDIPQDFPLTRPQRIQLDYFDKDEMYFDKQMIRKYTESAKFPAAFLHISSARPAVPPIGGLRPYQNLPFAFSLTKLNHICAEPEKCFYLAPEQPNLQEQLLKRFLEATSDIKTIFIFGQPNELRVLKDCAQKFPEMADEIGNRLRKVIDLAELFQKKYVYHSRLSNDCSLLSVMPVLGIDDQIGAAGIRSDYMAGVAFESLFDVKDLFGGFDTKQKLQHYISAQSSHIYQVFKMLREVGLSS